MRSLVIHGHFYQPPRENPFLERVEAEPTAAPHHDWNRRIEQECYRAVAAARVLGPRGRIARVVNTLGFLSFNVGPTLLEWLESEAPHTYAAILDADRESRRRLGHGNAIAQPYHHAILPLASRRDKEAEVRWGIADFRRRFGRDPEGMWLPETAVDGETLEVLAAAGIRFTVLAPRQVAKAPARGLPGRFRAGAGRTIAVFVYDGEASHHLAFGDALDDGQAWGRALAARFPAGGEPALLALASDGETYGHHHRFGEMALARMLIETEEKGEIRIENFASFLARHPPRAAIELVAPSSWSCAHGVERWRSDCGCGAAGGLGLGWRAPLRAAVDGLARDLHAVYEREAGPLLAIDPWQARAEYGAAVGAGPQAIADFARARARPGGGPERLTRIRELLEMERDALRIYTSCGWFFEDLGRLEPLEILAYAAHALALAGKERPAIEAAFLERLALARSDDPAIGDGLRLYRERIEPLATSPLRLAGSLAALLALGADPGQAPRSGFTAVPHPGSMRLVHRRTGRALEYATSCSRGDGVRLSVRVEDVDSGRVAVLDLESLTAPEREQARAILVRSLVERALDPGRRDLLGAGLAALPELAVAALVAAVEDLAEDRSAAARDRVWQLAHLLEALGLPLPFDAQTAFARARALLDPGEAMALDGVALVLGFER